MTGPLPGANDFTREISSQPPGAGRRATAAPGNAPVPAAPMIQVFEGHADPAGKDAAAPGPRSVSSWLPAGSYADALVLAGVDASAGVSSQSDPRPVLLRLLGPARSAAEGGEALEADVAGCTLTGAAYGDLSSEKVYVRLRTLTCAGPARGTVTETQVAGFVAGSGKAGVRGPVVSREGALVEKAFLAGLISGVGETAANLLQAPARTTGSDGDREPVEPYRARPGRDRRGRGIGGPPGGRLPDPPGRAVPAGDPAPDGHAGDRGVHRGRLARRAQ